ncbi:MAG TPA: MoxR family ATPase [Magnetospirillaceae bacterium]|nr:MoxR family ATPase [Magnetospirillaceae bacterium]
MNLDEAASRDAADGAQKLLARVREGMARRLVGKPELVNGILTAAVADGHVLMEGMPGLAKTLAVKTFAELAGLTFRRIQFTPDLLPGDITGSLFYDAPTGRFIPREGPVFTNVLLADEINRAPAKVQSALLEAMEERHVTIGERSLSLPWPFFVLATQNPIEHEGTFRLPEAQIDRFLVKVLADYPNAEEEAEIVRRTADGTTVPIGPLLSIEDIKFLRSAVRAVRVEPDVLDYAVRIVRASRPTDDSGIPQSLRELLRYVEYGASPRASIYLYRCARVGALFDGRGYALPEDVKAAAPAVLRHRILPSYEAEAEGVTPDAIVRRLLSIVPVP